MESKVPDFMDILENEDAECHSRPSRIRRYLCQYAATIIVNLNALAYGISVAWGSTALPVLESPETPLNSGPFSETDTSWLSSSLCLMAFLTTPIFSALSSRVSRKILGYVVASLHLGSWLILCITDMHVLIYVARILAGIAAGGTIVYVPLYVSEIAEDEIRGTLGCLFVFSINAGILFGYIVGGYVSYFTQTKIYFLIPLIFIFCYVFLPDTPFFLLKKNKTAEAIAALRKLRGGENSDVAEEISSLKSSLEKSGVDISLRQIFSSRGLVRGLVLSITICICQQLSGIFAILSFTVQIFNESGSSLSSTLASIIVGILQLFGTFLSLFLVERFGRKKLLLVSKSFIVFELGILGTYFYLKDIGVDVTSWSWIPLKCLSFYIMFFSIGLGPLPFVLLTELLPMQVRSFAASLALTSLWGVAFLVVLIFNPMAGALGVHGCYWLFSACTFLGVLFVIFFVPETKSRSIDEISDDLNEGPWILGKRKTLQVSTVK
ncbi:facilitated trehalose transporter Tret1 [Anabrus simplex]|uniref:facilitated trehalose transporter Tret1 n=1 Tax=Anabrus simplex TaxID=316456 RepID=UPI0035A36AEF